MDATEDKSVRATAAKVAAQIEADATLLPRLVESYGIRGE